MVQNLGAHVDDDGSGGGDDGSPGAAAAVAGPVASSSPMVTDDQGKGDRDNELAHVKRGMCPDYADADPRNVHPRKLGQEFGRLVVDDGKSRYVSNRFWASLGDEVSM